MLASLNNKLKNLSRILGVTRAAKGKFLVALAKEVGYKQLEQLVRQNIDRRELVTQAAQLLNIDESSLIKKLGNNLKLPVIQNVSELSADLSRFYDFDTLQRSAALPVYNAGILTGFAVANPTLAIQHLPDLTSQQLYLSSWQSIKQALDASKIKFDAWEKLNIEQLQKHVSQQVERVLISILNQTDQHNSNQVVIRSSAEEISYEFKATDGRRGRGHIHFGLKGALIDRMNQLVQVNTTEICYDSQAYVVSVLVLSPSEAYEIQIKEQKNLAPKAIAFNNEAGKSVLTSPVENVVLQPNDKREIRLLVVEDNQAFSKVLECFLSKQGFITTFASSGLQALELMQNGFSPDVLICDVHMPEMNGHELVRKLRLNLSTQNLPIIMLTSDHDTETELQFVDYGVDAFISKSSDPRLLVGYAKRLAGRKFSSKANQEAA